MDLPGGVDRIALNMTTRPNNQTWERVERPSSSPPEKRKERGGGGGVDFFVLS